MNKKTSYLIVFLSIIAAFLLGTAVAKVKYSQDSVAKPSAKNITPTGVPTPPFTPPKTGKPEVKFFVMSFCPYGNQAEAGLEPVYQLLKEKVSWQPRYIFNRITDQTKKDCEQSCPNRVFNDKAKEQCQTAITNGQVKDMETCKQYFPYATVQACITSECAPLKIGSYESLHGNQELNQDVREICAFNTSDDKVLGIASGSGILAKWWKFVSAVNSNCTAQNVDTCWQGQAKAAGLDTSQIASCSTSQKKTLIDQEIAETTKYKVSGSPTVLVNDTLYNGGRAPEDYKKAICSAFENPPAECSQTLGEGSASTSGGCAN